MHREMPEGWNGDLLVPRTGPAGPVSSSIRAQKKAAPKRSRLGEEMNFAYLAAAAAFTSSTKLRDSSDAPPMRPPSMSFCASSSGALAGFMEPP